MRPKSGPPCSSPINILYLSTAFIVLVVFVLLAALFKSDSLLLLPLSPLSLLRSGPWFLVKAQDINAIVAKIANTPNVTERAIVVVGGVPTPLSSEFGPGRGAACRAAREYGTILMVKTAPSICFNFLLFNSI